MTQNKSEKTAHTKQMRHVANTHENRKQTTHTHAQNNCPLLILLRESPVIVNEAFFRARAAVCNVSKCSARCAAKTALRRRLS